MLYNLFHMTPPRARQHFYGYSHLIDEGKTSAKTFSWVLTGKVRIKFRSLNTYSIATLMCSLLSTSLTPSLVHRRIKRAHYLEMPSSIEIQLWLLEADNVLWEHILRDELKG